MLLFLLICQWIVCKIVCNSQHYFGLRSNRESSCLEIRSSARFLRENLNFLICSENFRRGLCWRHCKYKEWVSFFLGSWEMNRSAEQTNRTRTASRFTRFVCSALRFISHEPRKKDTHSLKLTRRHINRRHFCFNIKSFSVHPLLWMNVMLDFICMVFAGMWTTFS